MVQSLDLFSESVKEVLGETYEVLFIRFNNLGWF